MPAQPVKGLHKRFRVLIGSMRVKNLTEAVEKVLVQCRAELQRSKKSDVPADPPATEAPSHVLVTGFRAAIFGPPNGAVSALSCLVVALHQQGMKTKEIAKRLGLGVRTIQRWLSEGSYVETNYHHRHRSAFDTYEAYVKQRWDEGCHNIQQLWRELKAQGYPHSDCALRKHLEPLCDKEPADFPEASCLDHKSRKKGDVALHSSDHRFR
jgi:hypothetical protein